MANSQIYPASPYPGYGDILTTPGSPATVVTGLQNYPISNFAPQSGQILTFVQGEWTPEAPQGSGPQGPQGPQGSSSGGGGVAVQSATVTLSSSQIQNLATTAIQIVPAPGAGTIIVPVSAVFNYVYGGTAYVIPPGQQLVLQWNSSTPNNQLPICNITGGGFLDQTSNQIAASQFEDQPSFGASTGYINQGIYVGAQTASNFTTGNGTVAVTVFYTVLTGMV